MTLLRLVRSFGLRRGLALWLLPEIEKEQARRFAAYGDGSYIIGPSSGTFTDTTSHGKYVVTIE